MRKSNIAIIAILVVASIVFLWMWFYFGFNLVDDPLDLVITIVWWAVIIAVCIAITLVEKRRRESIRTAFITDGAIYNSETGLVRLPENDSKNYVSQLRKILENLDYKTSVSNPPSKGEIRFSYIVHSPKFSQDGNVWSGEVVCLENPKGKYAFNNARELAGLING